MSVPKLYHIWCMCFDAWLRLVGLVVALSAAHCMLAILAFASFEGGPTVLRELAVTITCDPAGRCFARYFLD